MLPLILFPIGQLLFSCVCHKFGANQIIWAFKNQYFFGGGEVVLTLKPYGLQLMLKNKIVVSNDRRVSATATAHRAWVNCDENGARFISLNSLSMMTD